jgi:hypothetical protein
VQKFYFLFYAHTAPTNGDHRQQNSIGNQIGRLRLSGYNPMARLRTSPTDKAFLTFNQASAIFVQHAPALERGLNTDRLTLGHCISAQLESDLIAAF